MERRAPPSLLDSHGDRHWLVDRLLQKKMKSGKVFFLVHWKGFPKSSRTWEPRQALLEDVPDHVHAFEKLH
ncbi:chromo domain-containing protein [Herbaspirillum sp.]|uniref:chromo domain-containing protein n=1 Tax=Herbaspirillum sp. TaxID=1890675 RepID=UPI00338ED02C